MIKVKITLSYDGSKFNGFQVQNSGIPTVANKLYKILDSLGIKSKIDASGRTDTGVHALRQVISLQLPSFWSDLKKLKTYMNYKALPDIYIEDICEVPMEFHARYSAKKRQYRYIISTKTPRVFEMPYLLFTPKIDMQKIQIAIKEFEGEHDFSYFMKQHGGTEYFVREMYQTSFYQYRDFYIFTFQANGFLRSQIRMMVAFLLNIGRGDLTIDNLSNQLTLKEKISSDLVVPNGLYLSRIWY